MLLFIPLQNKPDDHCGEKRKAVTLPIDDNESLQKKAKKEWTCELCQISTTSEKGLNDHIQGKKHKANKESTRTQKIGKRKKTTLVRSPIETKKYKPACHPHQNK